MQDANPQANQDSDYDENFIFDLDDLRAPLTHLPDQLTLPTLEQATGVPFHQIRFNLRVEAPPSKSLTNRALLLAALADGTSIIDNPLLEADDAKRMIAALQTLGIKAELTNQSTTLLVHGRNGKLNGNTSINLNNAGTATRFLTAAAALADGPVTIDGNERMRQRPIGELIDLLRKLGVTVEELGSPGCPPITVHGSGTLAGGELDVPTTQSSQYLSALLMLAPWTEQGITLRFTGPVTSRSYVDMTTALLIDACAADVVEADDGSSIHVKPAHIPAFEHRIEPDASGATYLWAWAALFPKSTVRVPGVHFTSRQSDARFLMTLRQMGCAIEYAAGAADCTGATTLQGFDNILSNNEPADFEQMPDASLTLAAVAALANAPTTISGLRTLKVKETDRLAALQTELSKTGCNVTTSEDTLRIEPPVDGIDTTESAEPIAFDTYDDHRMAMALSLIALRRPNTTINDPACVAKTFPDYWATLADLYDAALDATPQATHDTDE